MKRIWLGSLAAALMLCACAAAPEEPTQTTVQTEPAPTETTAPARDVAAEYLHAMTVEEKVGQLFLARCPEENAVEELLDYHLGGYILFARDFENQTPDSLRQTLEAYQNAAAIPMLIAVDEEGGTVTRVSQNPAFRAERFPSPRNLFTQGGLSYVLALESEKAILLQELGINVNMAPVCDITTTPGAFLYARSLGESPEVTGQFAAGAVARMAEYKVGAVLKHFPGYGENLDTHTGIARDSRSLEQLAQKDLVPFRAGIAAGAGAVLISHTIVEALDGTMPASLSPAVYAYLRGSLDFTGVAVTDDLSMQAITDLYGAEESAVLAVLAGSDLLCSSDYRLQYPAVLQAVLEERISGERLDEAVYRVLCWKKSLGLISE